MEGRRIDPDGIGQGRMERRSADEAFGMGGVRGVEHDLTLGAHGFYWFRLPVNKAADREESSS